MTRVSKLSSRRVLLALALVLATLGGAVAPAAAQEEPTKVLVWTGTYGFRHPSITQAQRTFLELDAAQDDFTVEITENPADLNAAKLATTDVLVWVSTTGKPPMTEQQRSDIIRWSACGGGNIAFHAAADSNYGWAEYAELLGAQFDSHPYTGDALMTVEDDQHPITEGWKGKANFEINDEWYRWRGAKRIPGVSLPRSLEGVDVLLSLDETTIPEDIQSGPVAYEDDQPIAWTKTFRDGGRVYYNNMGHSDGTWSVSEFRTSIANGIGWVDDVALDPECFADTDAPLPPGPRPPAADPATVSQPCTLPEIGERTGFTWENSGPIRTLTPAGDELVLPSSGTPGNLAWGAQGYVLDLSSAGTPAGRVTVTLDIPVPTDDYDLSVTAPWGWYGSDALQGPPSEQVVIEDAPHCAVLWMYGDNLYGVSGEAPTLRVAVEPIDAVPGARDLTSACPPGEVPSAGYEDVKKGSAHAAAIDCVTWWEVARGTSQDTFSPDATLTRGQIASFVARMIERTGAELPSGENHFRDDDGNAHETAINQLAEARIVSGRTKSRYAPNGTVTRGEMATVLVRGYEYVAQRQVESSTDHFDDDDGTTHEGSINELADLRIASGVGPGTFAPERKVRRNQMASFLARTLAQHVDDGDAQPNGEDA